MIIITRRRMMTWHCSDHILNFTFFTFSLGKHIKIEWYCMATGYQDHYTLAIHFLSRWRLSISSMPSVGTTHRSMLPEITTPVRGTLLTWCRIQGYIIFRHKNSDRFISRERTYCNQRISITH